MKRWKFFDMDSWAEVLITLKTNKMRSILTAFGIFWGVFMLVLLMGGSNGLSSKLLSSLNGFATNSCILESQSTDLPYKGFQRGRNWYFETGDLERLRNQVVEIEALTPLFSAWSSVQPTVKNRKMQQCSLYGVDVAYRQIDAPQMRKGRFLTESDVYEGRKVCVIGKRVAEELFPDDDDPCGQRIQIQNVYYQVIGVNYRTGGGFGDPARTITIPYTTFQHIYNRGNRVDCIAFIVKPDYTVASVVKRVETILKRAHSIHPDDKQAVGSINFEEMFRIVDNLFNGISVLVWMIGLGTLFSGAVSVSNILMVTVRERTTEIGIRRAIGARPSDILWQILSESMVLTLLSGMSGIILAVWILQGLESVGNQNDWNATFQVSFVVAIGAAFLLALLGLLAGLAPAWRALSIKPIDAMRDE